MKKSHTKNLFSMAPTLHMFGKPLKEEKDKSMFSNNNNETVHRVSSQVNTSGNMKLNRSISSCTSS